MNNYTKSYFGNPSGHWTSQDWGSRSEYNFSELLSENEYHTKFIRLKGSSEDWVKIAKFENLEEIHLYAPTHEQISFISNIKCIKRLKIDCYRPKNIDFLSKLSNLEELSLEAVSGFEDLEPIKSLPKLRTLNLHMLRRVKNFTALESLSELKFLSIHGNFDFHQPVENLNFLEGLKKLEFLIFEYVRILEKERPAYPLIFSNKLKYVEFPRNLFSLEEFGFVAEVLKGVEGAEPSPVIKEIHFFHGNEAWSETVPWQVPDEKIDHIDMHRPLAQAIKTPSGGLLALGGLTDIGETSSKTGYMELLGRGSRGFNSRIKNAEKRCLLHIEKYEQAKTAARQLLADIKRV